MSQRTFSTLIVFALFVIVGLIAAAQGVIPPLDNIAGNLLQFVTPAIGVFYILRNWLDVIDAKITDGSLKPGDIMALFTMPDFFMAMVAALSGIFQTFGLKVMDADTQTFLVNSILVAVNVLLRSFTDRPPTSTQFVKSQSVGTLTVSAEATSST